MGFFSWNCAECGKSIRNQYADKDHQRVHGGICQVLPDDSTVEGDYEGYGSIEGHDIYAWIGDGDRDDGIRISFSDDGPPPDKLVKVLHRKCNHGQKYADLNESPTADDQGYF